jgi:CheY-like chemotaxis protein
MSGNALRKTDADYTRGHDKRILLVDDNLAGAQTMRMLLEMDGYQVTVAATGREALEIYRTLLPSIVLLDIGLPDIDGYQVARDIRECEVSQNPMLIAVSGWGDEVARTRAFDAGFEHYLAKPIQFELLEELVQARNSDD